MSLSTVAYICNRFIIVCLRYRWLHSQWRIHDFRFQYRYHHGHHRHHILMITEVHQLAMIVIIFVITTAFYDQQFHNDHDKWNRHDHDCFVLIIVFVINCLTRIIEFMIIMTVIIIISVVMTMVLATIICCTMIIARKMIISFIMITKHTMIINFIMTLMVGRRIGFTIITIAVTIIKQTRRLFRDRYWMQKVDSVGMQSICLGFQKSFI